jgi:radical SAM superfamily enzyme YgiQ (UPF0313 family)
MYKDTDFKLKLIFPCEFEGKTDNAYHGFSVNYLPYGMGILTAFLRKHNYYVEQEDLSVKFNRYNALLPLIFKNIDLNKLRNEEETSKFFKSGDIKGNLSLLIDKILDSSPIEGFDVIGFSISSYLSFILALLLSKRLKQRTNAPIVFGGAFICLYGHFYPKAFEFIDYIIIGDGRVPLLKLIDYLKKSISISDVPNLSYRNNGKLTVNQRQHYPIEDIPMPDFDGLPMELYKTRFTKGRDYISLPYQITRGCTNRCSFCCNIYVNNKLEFKSYDKVLSELSQMKQRYKSKLFGFCDDGINNSYEYLEGLCNLFIKNKLNINWSVYVKVGNLDKHILRKSKEAGCQWLFFGIESGSDRMLKMMNKGFTSEQAGKTLRDSYEAGITNLVSLIAGYPHETQEDIRQTIDFIRKNKKYIHYLRLHNFRLLYNSPIYYNSQNYGVENLRPAMGYHYFAFDECIGLKWEQKQKQQDYSERQIAKAIYKYSKFNWKVKTFLIYCFRLFRTIVVKFQRLCHLI